MKFNILLVTVAAAATTTAPLVAAASMKPHHRHLSKKDDNPFDLSQHCTEQDESSSWRGCPTDDSPNKVQICHWDNDKGYETLCINDADAKMYLSPTEKSSSQKSSSSKSNSQSEKSKSANEESEKSKFAKEESEKSKSIKSESTKSTSAKSEGEQSKSVKATGETSKESDSDSTKESNSNESTKEEAVKPKKNKNNKKDKRRRLGSERNSKDGSEMSGSEKSGRSPEGSEKSDSGKSGRSKESSNKSFKVGSDKSAKGGSTKPVEEEEDEPLMPDLCGPCSESQLTLDPLAVRASKSKAPPKQSDSEKNSEHGSEKNSEDGSDKTPKTIEVDPKGLINQYCANVDWDCSNNDNQVKVRICHANNGNKGWKEICVGESSIEAHLVQGHKGHNEADYCGPCMDGEPTTPTPPTTATPPNPTITTTIVGQPFHTGGSYGDPHIKTWKGKIFDFHGECDLVLANSQQFADGKGLDIHIRTEIRHDWSFISGVALRIGDETLEVEAKGLHFLNGVKGAVTAANGLRGVHSHPTIAGFPISYSQHMKIEQRYEIDLGAEHGKILIKAIDRFLAVNVQDATDKDFAESVGLMGEFLTGNKLGRDGKLMEDDIAFGLEWQVRDTEPKLFQESKGPQWPQKCRLPEATAVSRRRLDESTVSYADAIKACGHWPEADRDTCIYDVLSTGELALAQSGVF